MKKNGFTLIELLAAIMVLALIALISTPIILKVIEKAEKGSFEDSAYGVLDAAKLYYVDINLDEKGKEETLTFPGDNKLKLSGKKPVTGKVILEEDGKVGLAISNGKWCAIKNQNEEKVRIIEYSIGDCKIKGNETDESCFVVNDSGDTITNYTCTDTDVIIPSEINGKVITKIGISAFSNKNLTSVKISESVTSINGSAFSNNQLQSVTIPDSVTSIDGAAFFNNQLQSVTIPDSVITIFSNAFANNQLQSITIPDSVIDIGMGVFENNQLTSIKIGKGLTSLDDETFEDNKLVSIIIPSNVKNIGTFAFFNNKLQNVELSEGIISIGAGAFNNNQLQSITIPSSVTSIGSNAFYRNQSGMKVIINKPVGSITGSSSLWGVDSIEWTG